MKCPQLIALLLTFAAAPAIAASVAAEPLQRELQLVYVFDGPAPEFLLVIGQSGFKTVAALEAHLETWPPGSELKWAPGCMRLGGEPLSSESELQAFKTFLASRKIRFVLIPSG